MTEDEQKIRLAYMDTLQVGERVIETAHTCQKGMLGTIYKNDKGHLCVLWSDGLGTSVTWGTRRINEQ